MPNTKPFDNHSDEYDNWFIENRYVFLSELEAVKMAIPKSGKGIEIGIGSGIFAERLGINEGIEPSKAMREKAKKRNINAINAVAEKLPYSDNSIDFTLMITSICFVDDINKSFEEINRILKDNGVLIIGFVDKDSPIGKEYLKYKDDNLFYKNAIFYGTKELFAILKKSGFILERTFQTVFGNLNEINYIQEALTGFGLGSFVVIRAKKEVL